MSKKIISFVVLFLILLNIPSILLETQSIALSSPVSYFTFFLLGVLIIINKAIFPKQILFIAGISSLYFFISAFQYEESLVILLIDYVKFLLYLFGLFISLQYINQNTIILLLLAGVITILLDSLYFRFNDFQGIGYVSEYGRYSGFYLNPNNASFVCAFGYILTITKKNSLKLLAILFTFFGFLTLSRSFMGAWIIITSIYFFFNRKYLVKSIYILIFSGIILVQFSEQLKLDLTRFEFLTNLFLGNIDQEVLNYDSRSSQWAKFYEGIVNSPIIGNGYSSFGNSLDGQGDAGVHNSFLLVLGESGFLPFSLIIALFISLLYRSLTITRQNITPFLLTISLIINLMVSHVFFSSGIQIFILVFIIYNLTKKTANKLV
jgi:O-antigen ligase|tara:strand:+ start:288 stop:1421 length:1134 start_codon:yes stop_codon:yes gene_type:complete